MAGVNRSNVAVTDTFDTWRLRTNEINTTLNEATQAITANTIIFRDDSSNFTANQASLNTVAVVHGTTTSAISVTSALAADGTKASIITTGGIRAELGSIFAADVDIQGSITLGNASADNLTLNATLSSDLIPTTNAATDIGSSAFTFKNLYNQSIDSRFSIFPNRRKDNLRWDLSISFSSFEKVSNHTLVEAQWSAKDKTGTFVSGKYSSGLIALKSSDINEELNNYNKALHELAGAIIQELSSK